ncbi:MAG: DUF1294 domain-containing protein [Bacteroidales bacterium]|nr:DUF1294 domain-containing protein [Bacteroidales bacterium]
MSDIIAIAYVLFINVLAFVLYGIDKRRSQRKMYRISESTLLWMARLGGGVGSWMGIKGFNHKTKHTKFRVLVPVWIFIWAVVIGCLVIKCF